jgi:hypothetical protein
MPTQRPSRRLFLQTAAAAGASLGLGEWAGLAPLSPASADDAKVTPDLVRFGPDLEPVVKLIEETPRHKRPAMMIGQLKNGLPYRHFLAALYLANIRSGEVGHALAVVHSAEQLALDMPVQERLLPLFYALDRVAVGASLRQLTGKLPSAERAEAELHEAMRAYDPDRAERAVAVLARTQGAARVIEPLWHYGARDYGIVGHFAIYTAATVRPLRTVGWRHAEPSLRALVRTIVGDRNGVAKQPYAANVERARKAVSKFPADWAEAIGDPGLTKDLHAAIREGKGDEACELVVGRLAAGKGRAGAVWDAVHLTAAELVLANKPFVESHQTATSGSLHNNTTANALHYAFRASGDPETRLFLLLQAVAWAPLFRGPAGKQGPLAPLDVTKLVGADTPEKPDAAAEEILALRSSDRDAAAAKAFTFARKWPDAQVLLRAAGRLLPLKASVDPHDMKFPIAMFEDYRQVSPEWRPHKLAAVAVSFQASDRPDAPIIHQAREALRGL